MNRYESLDTSIILRGILSDNEELCARAEMLMSDCSRQFWLDKLVITEAVFQLERVRHWKRESIMQAIKYVMMRPNIICNIGVVSDVLDMYVSHPKLSFNDCFLAIEAAVAGNIPLWTLDQKLASQARGMARLA